jgi:hypothetical protein
MGRHNRFNRTSLAIARNVSAKKGSCLQVDVEEELDRQLFRRGSVGMGPSGKCPYLVQTKKRTAGYPAVLDVFDINA